MQEKEEESKVSSPIVEQQNGFTSSRLTDVTSIDMRSYMVFEYPPKDKEEEYMAQGVYINGFENDAPGGNGSCFNVIMSNGVRST